MSINSGSIISTTDQGAFLVELLPSLQLLEQYDKGEITLSAKTSESAMIDIVQVEQIIELVTTSLANLGENVRFFGQKKDEAINSIILNLYQSFDKVDIYPFFEDKAAHLLYLVIKDHPFVDGNKRIGTSLFVYYLQINGIKLNGNSKNISSLSLYIAQSPADQKDLIIDLIINFIQNLKL